ncbi:hypothetical protein AeNC1_005728 [Aphanomyces euteiches]|nr:hypothetical protein AeNC1_005728 [Aphanomyces euteiches]
MTTADENNSPIVADEAAKDFAAFGQESVQILLARVSDDDVAWSLAKEMDGVVVSRGVVPGNEWNCMKAVTRIQCSAEFLAGKLTDPTTMTSYDDNTDSVDVIKVVDDNTKILHVRAKAVFPTTAREVVIVTAKGPIENGIVIATRSIEHEEVPLNPCYVRATTYISGYILTPISETECEVTMIVHMNLGGSVPSFIINMFAVDAPISLLRRLRDLYE